MDAVTKNRLLPPGPGNPRNSEGDFIQLRDGRLLFVYTHFTGGGDDNDSAYLAGRFSADGGRTWSGEDVVVVPKEGVLNIMSVSLLRLQSGKIALLYLRKDAVDDCRAYLRFSNDEAKSWSAPILCMAQKGYFVVNNDRLIQLKNGRLLIPAGWHNAPTSGKEWRAVDVCFLSDDEGKTWRMSKTLLEGPAESRTWLQEPGVIELKDGRLMLFARTDLGCQCLSWSEDGGETWSPVQRSDILSPLSPATIKRIPQTGDLLMVWNDHKGIAPALKDRRTPLTVAISRDEGRTWEHVKTLEDDPDGWYCYTAAEFVGEDVLLAYCATGKGQAFLSQTQITRFPVAWLYR